MTVDGVDVRDVTQAGLRRSIGMLQQGVFMFAGTVRDNIRYGRPNATEEENEKAARRAEIHKEILAMPAASPWWRESILRSWAATES